MKTADHINPIQDSGTSPPNAVTVTTDDVRSGCGVVLSTTVVIGKLMTRIATQHLVRYPANSTPKISS